VTPSEVLLAHAKRIETGELTWIGGTPYEAGQCCIGFVNMAESIVFDDKGWADVVFALTAEAYERDSSVTFIEWNDTKCKDAAEAVEFIRAAAARCPE
jgi:hypothetical protein